MPIDSVNAKPYRPTAGVVIYHDAPNRTRLYLAVQSSNNGKWNIINEGKREGVDLCLEDAIMRGIPEEVDAPNIREYFDPVATGIKHRRDYTSASAIASYGRYYRGKELFFFYVKYAGDPSQVSARQPENRDARWCNQAELFELIREEDREFVARVIMVLPPHKFEAFGFYDDTPRRPPLPGYSVIEVL